MGYEDVERDFERAYAAKMVSIDKAIKAYDKEADDFLSHFK